MTAQSLHQFDKESSHSTKAKGRYKIVLVKKNNDKRKPPGKQKTKQAADAKKKGEEHEEAKALEVEQQHIYG